METNLDKTETLHEKPYFCVCENKGADHLRGERAADQRLCFRYIDSTYLFFLNPKFQASSSSVAVLPGLWSGTPKTGFLAMRLKLYFLTKGVSNKGSKNQGYVFVKFY